MSSKSLYQTFLFNNILLLILFWDKKIINRKKVSFTYWERLNFWKILSVLDLIVQIGRKMDDVH